jgi:SNF2 family DNA or RNA helicase
MFEDGTADLYCINWESLPKVCRELFKGKTRKQLPFDTVVFDELTAAKNPKSLRARAFLQQGYKVPRRWGLTGTPRPNGSLDLFGQFKLLCQENPLGRSYTHFKENLHEVTNPHSDFPKYRLKPEHEGTIERKLSDIALTLRSEDWLDVPPTTIEDIHVALPKSALASYKKLEKELLLMLREDFEVVAFNAGVLAMKLVQMTSGAVYETTEDGSPSKRWETVHGAKIEALRSIYESEGRQPLLVATQFKHEVARILEEVPGAEPFKEDSLERWNRGEIPILVAHPKSIGHGLNLQFGGSRVVWFSLHWSRELYDQFNARLVRKGQTEETRIFRLICPGTVDDAVAETLREKGKGQSSFMETLKNLQELVA